MNNNTKINPLTEDQLEISSVLISLIDDVYNEVKDYEVERVYDFMLEYYRSELIEYLELPQDDRYDYRENFYDISQHLEFSTQQEDFEWLYPNREWFDNYQSEVECEADIAQKIANARSYKLNQLVEDILNFLDTQI